MSVVGNDIPVAPASSAYIGSVNLAGQIGDKLFSFGQIVLVAAILGASPSADTFFLASIVPLTIGFVVGDPVGRACLTLLVRETDDRSAVALAASAFVLTTLVTLALTMLYDVIVVVLVKLFTPSGSGDVVPWLIFSTVGPAMAVAGLFAGVLTWRHDYAWAAARVPLASLAGLVALGVAALVTSSLAWIAAAVSFGYVLAAILLYVRVVKVVGRGWLSRISSRSLSAAAGARRLLVGPSIGGAIGGQVIVMIERALAGTVGRGAVASVSYARGIATAPTVLAQAVGASSYPRLVRAEASGDDAHLRESFERGMRLSLYLGVITAAFLILFGPEAVAAFFERGQFGHAQTARVGGTVVAFAASTFTGSVIVYLVSVIYGIGRFGSILWLELAIFAVYVVAAPIGVATDEVRGLAFAFAIAQFAGAVVAITVVMRALSIRGRTMARTVAEPIVPLAAIVVAALCGYRLAIDEVTIPVGLRGDVRLGGALLCFLVFGAAILLLSPLPESAQLRRFVLRRPR